MMPIPSSFKKSWWSLTKLRLLKLNESKGIIEIDLIAIFYRNNNPR